MKQFASIPPQLEEGNGLVRVDADLSEVLIADGDYAARKLGGLSLDSSAIERTNFGECDLSGASFIDVRFTGSMLDAAQARRSNWRRVDIFRSRFTGIRLYDAIIRDVQFVDCKLDLANFRHCKLQDVTFKDCIMTTVDFAQSNLRNVTFDNCNLIGADFSSATLFGKVDLRSSQLVDIVGVGSLKNAIITYNQLLSLAPSLASHIGLNVRDE